MTKTKLLKLLYLFDIEYYRAHQQTFTSFGWKFFHLGPWATEFDPALDELVAKGTLLQQRSNTELVADPLALDSAVAALRHYSLAEVTAGVLNIHRLVLTMTRERQDEKRKHAWAQVASRIAAARLPSSVRPEMASILFIDLVHYSLLRIDEQAKLISHLQAAVRQAPTWKKAEARGHVLTLPTGDGVALVFLKRPPQQLSARWKLRALQAATSS